MAVARQNNQDDLDDYALLAAAAELIASQFVFVKNNELDIEKFATSLLELESIETDTAKLHQRYRKLRSAATDQFPTSIFYKLLYEITNSTVLAEFDFGKVSEPYFNYLKAFLGKAHWQIETRAITIPAAPPPLTHHDTPQLPGELWIEVLSHLSFKDLINARYVNKFFKQAVDATPINELLINTKHLTIAINVPPINKTSFRPSTLPEFFARFINLPEEERKNIRNNVLGYFNSITTSKYGKIYLPGIDTMDLIYSEYRISRIICIISALEGGMMSAFLFPTILLSLLGLMTITMSASLFILSALSVMTLIISAGILIHHAIKHDELLVEIDNGIAKNKIKAAPCLRFFDRVDLEAKKIAERKEELAKEKALDPSLKHAGMTSLKHAGMKHSEHVELTAIEIRDDTPILKTLTTQGDMIAVSDDEEAITTNGYTLR